MSLVITQVLKRARLDVDSVPQRSAVEFMTRELGAIAELQTAEVVLGTDGAASMVGKDKGAVKIIVDRQVLQEGAGDNQCRAVGQHCSAHKLNLAASHTGRGFPRIERLKKTLSKLHEFYSRSAVRTKGLVAVQGLLNESLDASGKVPNPSKTRWLALGKCVTSLKDILPSVLISLGRESEERADVTAAGLLHFMTNLDFLLVLLLLCEVLPTVNRLSMVFQESLIDFSKISKHISATLNSLEAKKESSLSTKVQQLAERIESQAAITVKIEVNKIEDFENQVKKPFINVLIENIKRQFENSDIMSAFSHFFNKELYNKDNFDMISSSVKTLSNQFGFI